MLSYNLKTIIFQCAKNKDSPVPKMTIDIPTRVTRLEIVPNIADPIVLNEKIPYS